MFYSTKQNVVLLALLTLLSILTTNHYSPKFLNADLILNSIMSLQNITLFYWGQDRLLNVAPFIMHLVTDPTYNMLFYLFLSSFFFFSLVWYLSYFIILMSKTRNFYEHIFVFFVFFVFLLGFLKENIVFEIAVWHIEYSLSYLLISIALKLFIENIVYDLKYKITIALLYFIAVGVNYSILIPILAFFILYYIIKKEKLLILTFNILTVFLSFAIWSLIARKYGVTTHSYMSFNFDSIDANMVSVVNNIVQSLNLLYIFLFLFLVLAINILKKNFKASPFNYIIYSSVFFMIAWLLFFSNIKWIAINQYHVRYFFPILVFIPFLSTYLLTNLLTQKNLLIKYILGVLSIIFIFWNLHGFVIDVKSYKVFEEYKEVSDSNEKVLFHGGDYWQMWSSVMYDLMQNKESYGVGYRSDGNRINLLKTLKIKHDNNEIISLYCHNTSDEECINEIKMYSSDLQTVSTTKITDKINLIKLRKINENNK